MIVALSDIPTYERHLLFCSRLDGRRRRRTHHRRRDPQVPPMNRSLAVHGECVSTHSIAVRPVITVPATSVA
jgi:hypothetical protein